MFYSSEKLITKNIFVFLVFFILSLIIYGNSLDNEFVFDDRVVIVQNPYIKNFSFLPNIFRQNVFYPTIEKEKASNYYRPIPILSLAFDYRLWGLRPFGYRLENILLHVLNSYLVFKLILLLFSHFNLAFLSAILFLIHPLHGVSVVWIVCRDNLLTALFGLLTLLCYIQYSRNAKNYYYLLSLLFFLISLFSKEVAVTLIFLLVLVTLKMKEKPAVIFKRLFLFAVISISYIYFRKYVIKIPFTLLHNDTRLTIELEILNSIIIIMEYLRLLFLPFSLRILRTTPFLTSLFSWHLLIAFAFGGFLVFALVWSIQRKKSVIWFGISWFILSLTFIFRSMHLVPLVGALMLEQWMYIPSVGFFIIFGRFLLKLVEKSKMVFALVFGVIVFLWAFLAIYNNTFWKDEITLFKRAAKLTPSNYMVKLNLAYAYLEAGEVNIAEKEFIEALKIRPADAGVYLGLGITFAKQDKVARAIDMFRKSLWFSKGRLADSWNNLGIIYVKRNEKNLAFNCFMRALKNWPDSDIINRNLGLFYLEEKDYPEATSYFLKATKLNPDDESYFVNLGMSYMLQNQVKESLAAFKSALKINPRSITTLSNTGSLFANMGYFDSAIEIWKRALALSPDNEYIKHRIKVTEELLHKVKEKQQK